MASGTVYQKAGSIEEAQDLWHRATAAGDTELAQQYHKDAEAMRAKEGYSGGADGSQHIPLAPGTKVDSGSIDLGNASYIPGGLGGNQNTGAGGSSGTGGGSAGKPGGGGSGSTGYSRSPEIDALVNAQKQAALAQLKAAVQKQVSGYNEQIAGLEPQYQGLRSQSEVERYKSQKALRESLANSGELSGGQGRQDLLNLQNAYSSRLNELNSQQQAQMDSLSRAIAEAKSQGELSAAMMAAQYDAKAAELGLSDRYRYEDNLYRDKQAAFQNALAEAGLTGVYNGQNTLAMQQYLTDKALAEGQLTGTYNGVDTLAKTQADRQYGLDYANTYGQSMDGTMQTQAAKEADRQFALAEGELTGWYKGLPTTTQQQIDIQFAQYQQSTGQQKRDNALQLLQMGMYNPQIAADAGMDDATAQYIANYARQTMQNDLTSQGLANQQAQADIANTQANTNRLNSNFSSGGGRGGSTSSRGSGGGGGDGPKYPVIPPTPPQMTAADKTLNWAKARYDQEMLSEDVLERTLKIAIDNGEITPEQAQEIASEFPWPLEFTYEE